MKFELPKSFHHSPPKGYFFEAEKFKKDIIRIWLCNTHKFIYNDGAETRTIHSFYNTKTGEYFAPVNSKTIGGYVNIKDTRAWTSMPLKYQGVERFFV